MRLVRSSVSLHETASETMLAIYDLRDARAHEVTITDATGSQLTEMQLAMLVLVERVRPEPGWRC